MTRNEAIRKAIDIIVYLKAHFAKSQEARKDAEEIIEALEQINEEQRDRKIGHWEYDREHCDSLNVAYTCSCCGRRVFVPYPFAIFYKIKRDVYKSYPYCHCGAKMLEVKE